MRLTHGTRASVGRAAITEGLKPRKLTKTNNWAHSSPSNANAVYLTETYGLFFAVSAANMRREEKSEVALVEVETERLSPFQLCPDEDTLEQAFRGHDGLPERWTMRQRTVHYRNSMHEYANGEHWRRGIETMGTCAHLGPIPPKAITRVAIINAKEQAGLLWQGIQPMVSLLNHRFCADKYRELTAQVWEGGPGITILEGTTK